MPVFDRSGPAPRQLGLQRLRNVVRKLGLELQDPLSIKYSPILSRPGLLRTAGIRKASPGPHVFILHPDVPLEYPVRPGLSRDLPGRHSGLVVRPNRRASNDPETRYVRESSNEFIVEALGE